MNLLPLVQQGRSPVSLSHDGDVVSDGDDKRDELIDLTHARTHASTPGFVLMSVLKGTAYVLDPAHQADDMMYQGHAAEPINSPG